MKNRNDLISIKYIDKLCSKLRESNVEVFDTPYLKLQFARVQMPTVPTIPFRTEFPPFKKPVLAEEPPDNGPSFNRTPSALDYLQNLKP